MAGHKLNHGLELWVGRWYLFKPPFSPIALVTLAAVLSMAEVLFLVDTLFIVAPIVCVFFNCSNAILSVLSSFAVPCISSGRTLRWYSWKNFSKKLLFFLCKKSAGYKNMKIIKGAKSDFIFSHIVSQQERETDEGCLHFKKRKRQNSDDLIDDYDKYSKEITAR